MIQKNYNQKKPGDTWDLEISSKQSLFDLRLNDIWRYKDLLRMFVIRDFKAFYKQTILGPVWFFIQPLFTMSVYIFVFGKLAGLSTDGIPPALFYLSGIICWTYFQECLLRTANIFRTEAPILGKVYFPRLIMPISAVISSLIRFGVQTILFITVLTYFVLNGELVQPSYYIILLPVLIFCLAVLALGFGMIISALTTKYRDLALLLTFGTQLLMYATTVVYPLSSLSGKLRLLIGLNPLTTVIEGMRKSIFGQGVFDGYSLLYLVTITLIVFLIGLVTFNKVERSFVDTI